LKIFQVIKNEIKKPPSNGMGLFISHEASALQKPYLHQQAYSSLFQILICACVLSYLAVKPDTVSPAVTV